MKGLEWIYDLFIKSDRIEELRAICEPARDAKWKFQSELMDRFAKPAIEKRRELHVQADYDLSKWIFAMPPDVIQRAKEFGGLGEFYGLKVVSE